MSVYDDVVGFFERAGQPVHRDDEQRNVSVHYEGANGSWPLVAQAFEDRGQLVVYSLCPIEIPQEHRTAAAVFLTDANAGMYLGNFELYREDGEVRFKTSIDARELSDELIKPLIAASVAMMDRYLPGIAAVAAGAGAAAALALVEG